jgi:hypothetical protein
MRGRLRHIALACAGAVVVAASVANACSCIGFPTQAEADAAGERAYRAADLIVDATPGAEPASYSVLCGAAGSKPRPQDVGRSITLDRPLTIHRVLKGKAPKNAVLAGQQVTAYAGGCGIMTNSCDVGIAPGARNVFVLQREKDGRYRMANYCSLVALRQSRRGAQLFGPVR